MKWREIVLESYIAKVSGLLNVLAFENEIQTH